LGIIFAQNLPDPVGRLAQVKAQSDPKRAPVPADAFGWSCPTPAVRNAGRDRLGSVGWTAAVRSGAQQRLRPPRRRLCLEGETERAAAELAEARRLNAGVFRASPSSGPRTGGVYQMSAPYWGLHKAAMPEELPRLAVRAIPAIAAACRKTAYRKRTRDTSPTNHALTSGCLRHDRSHHQRGSL